MRGPRWRALLRCAILVHFRASARRGAGTGGTGGRACGQGGSWIAYRLGIKGAGVGCGTGGCWRGLGASRDELGDGNRH